VASASEEESAVVVYDPNRVLGPGSSARLAVARTRSRRATARVLAVAVDARDPETRRHSENVADLASALALMLDLSAERGQVLDLAAQMHDVGKIGVPDTVLRASGEISDEQRELIEQHSVLGERILAAARLDEILPAVRHHHERWDGTGYPDGLSGTDIPLEARILTVCDAYESMTAPRSYAQNLSVEEAIAEIERFSGTQFDPDIAAPFCRMIGQIHGASARDRAGRMTGEQGPMSELDGD
jgi:HD-GYP domain-containing protein (c-di-GMP phosphodiesterase class II)